MDFQKLVASAIVLVVFAMESIVSAQAISASSPLADSNQRNPEGQYLIGKGDVLDIRVYDRPQLSREAVRVDGRGMIKMPLIKEPIQANCRSDSDLAQEISKRYLEYLRNPHVEVFIKDFQSKPIAVIGAVREPGRFQMHRQIRLLELLSLVGGPTEQAGGRIQIVHDLRFRPCNASPVQKTAANENSTDSGGISSTDRGVSFFELRDLLKGGEIDQHSNPLIQPGDIINLIEADKIYVVGNVYRPLTIPLRERITLTEAIAMAGGTMPDTNLDRIRISRRAINGNTKTEIIADLKAINRKKAADIVLEPNDIIEVPTSNGKRFVHGLINGLIPGIFRLPLRVIP